MYLIRSFLRLIYEKQQYAFYVWPTKPRPIIEASKSTRIITYTTYRSIPRRLLPTVLPNQYINMMYYRLRAGEASLICIFDDDEKVLMAYGWIQSWASNRRKFAAIAEDGIMLGPYWTDPRYRGRGLYVQMLVQSLGMTDPLKTPYIYTSPDNIASLRGIQKAGFIPIGQYTITVYIRKLFITKAIRSISLASGIEPPKGA